MGKPQLLYRFVAKIESQIWLYLAEGELDLPGEVSGVLLMKLMRNQKP